MSGHRPNNADLQVLGTCEVKAATCRQSLQTESNTLLSAAGETAEEEAVLPEEAEAGEEYGSPRETARDDASSCSEGDYRAVLGPPLRAVHDGAALVFLRSLLFLPASLCNQGVMACRCLSHSYTCPSILSACIRILC